MELEIVLFVGGPRRLSGGGVKDAGDITDVHQSRWEGCETAAPEASPLAEGQVLHAQHLDQGKTCVKQLKMPQAPSV